MEYLRTLLLRYRRQGTSREADALIAPPGETRDVSQLISVLGLVAADPPVSELRGWRPPSLVLVNSASQSLLDWLSEVAPNVELQSFLGPEEGLSKINNADAVIGYLSPQMLEAGDRLRWVQLHVAGVEGVLPQRMAAERNLLVTNLKGIAAPVIAEHAFSLLLSLNRKLQHFRLRQAQQRWAQFELPENDYGALWGRSLLVVGFGGIGSRCAQLGAAFGMRVSAVRNSGGKSVTPQYIDHMGLPSDMPTMLPKADVIINALPLTAQTKGLFDQRLFDHVRAGALFLNVGRGGTVVTADLVHALRSGRLAGVGLDVVDPEPLPRDHALWDMPQVVLTPHVAGLHGAGHAVSWTLIRENLRRYVAGEAMLSVVDLARGY